MNLFWTCIWPAGKKKRTNRFSHTTDGSCSPAGGVGARALCYSCTDFLFPKKALGSKTLPFFNPWLEGTRIGSCTPCNVLSLYNWHGLYSLALGLNKTPCLQENINTIVSVSKREQFNCDYFLQIRITHLTVTSSLHSLPRVRLQINLP